MKQAITAFIILLTAIEAPFPYDESKHPVGWDDLYVGSWYVGTRTVTELDGDEVTLECDNPAIGIERVNIVVHTDGSKVYRYKWTWRPTEDDIGVHYIKFKAIDALGATDERYCVVRIRINRPPIIG